MLLRQITRSFGSFVLPAPLGQYKSFLKPIVGELKLKQKIESIIINALKIQNKELKDKTLSNPTSSTEIFGRNGALDSLALVSLIADLEDLVADRFDKDIILADDKAMSQKTSPFRNVRSLTDYIEILINEDI